MAEIEFEGRRFSFPDDASRGEITAALKQYIDRQSQQFQDIEDQVNRADTLSGKMGIMLRAMLDVARRGRDAAVEQLGEENVRKISEFTETLKQTNREAFGETLGNVINAPVLGAEELNTMMDDPENAAAGDIAFAVAGMLAGGAAIRQGKNIFKTNKGESLDDLAAREDGFDRTQRFEVGEVDEAGAFTTRSGRRADPEAEFDEVFPDDGVYEGPRGETYRIRGGEVRVQNDLGEFVEADPELAQSLRVQVPREGPVSGRDVMRQQLDDMTKRAEDLLEENKRLLEQSRVITGDTQKADVVPLVAGQTRQTAPAVGREGVLVDFTDDDTVEGFRQQVKQLPQDQREKAMKNLEAIIKDVAEGPDVE